MVHEVEFTLPQWEMMHLECRNPLFVGGYGSGKTTSLMCNSLRDALSFGEVKIGSYCPTYDLLKLNLIPRMEEMLTLAGYPYHLNKQDYVFTLFNGSKIIMRSMDNPARIVAYDVFRSHVDEIDTLKRAKAEDVWNKIKARNRQKVTKDGKPVLNTVSAYTTPDHGFASFTYKRWKKNATDGYQFVRSKTSDNPHLPEDYVRQLEETYTDEMIDAYVNGLWCNFNTGIVYRKYDRARNRSRETYRKGETVRIGMDFNVGKMALIVYVERPDGWHAIKEKTDGYDTPAMIEWIEENIDSPKILVYPDATGKARKTTDASKSDIVLLRNAGFTVVAKNVNPLVRDRVLSVNKGFERQHLWVNDDECPTLAESLEQQGYGIDGTPDKKSGHDHPNDAAGYPYVYHFPIKRPEHNGMTVGGY